LNESSSSSSPLERTEVLYGNEKILERTLQTFSNIKEELAGCFDHAEVAMHVTIEPLWNGFIQLKRNGVRLKTITEATAENISYVKKLTEFFEVRHLTGVRSNFGVVDRKECMLHSISHEEQPLSHAIISNAKALVEAQQYLFETLWNKAIPAEEKIKEIEEGIRPPFIETLKDPYKIQKLGFDLVNLAKEEILMLFFPPNNAFLRDQYAGVIELLKEAVTLRAIRVRILTSKDEQEQIDRLIQEIMIQKGWKQERQARVGRFEIHSVDTRQHQQSLPANVSILISDSKVSLVEELKDYAKNNSNKRISLATHSNSESTVLTYISIFETLWAQAELKLKPKKR
jgi:two-component system, OmpR family, sensor histidine kinase VicK